MSSQEGFGAARDKTSVEFTVLQLALPGEPLQNVGVLALEPATGQLLWRLRGEWASIAGEEAAVLERLSLELQSRVDQIGGSAVLEQLEDTLSNILRISQRRRILTDDVETTVARLFDQYVEHQKDVSS